MKAVRSPASSSSENDDRQARDTESETLRNARDSYYPILRRIRESSDFFTEFYAARFRAIALFGKDAETPYVEFWQSITLVQVAASMLLRPDFHGDHPRMTENRQKMEERIWEGLADKDAITSQMDEAVRKAEELFRPIIVEAAPPILTK